MSQSKLFNLYLAGQATASEPLIPVEADLISNSREPLSSDDPPTPAGANFYRSDDHIYYHLNNKWKRTPILSFSP